MGIGRAACLALSLLAAWPAGAAERLLELTPRPNATLRVLTDQPEGPLKGSVILLVGGSGILDIDATGRIGGLGGNQLARSRATYAKAGYAYWLPDIASDLKPQQGYRFKPAFGTDLGLVVAEARKLGAPVHVVGTSRGAVSVAALFNAESRNLPDSATITSGMLITYKATAADALGPGSIRVPVLLLRHRDDGCSVTPPSDAERYAKLLARAPRVDILTLTGGAEPKGDPCEAQHYHGFWGMDGVVTQTITGWLDGLQR